MPTIEAIAASDLSGKGMKIAEAFELAKSRGYAGKKASYLRDAYRKKPDYGKQFGLDRVEFKDGTAGYLYFDVQTHS